MGDHEVEKPTKLGVSYGFYPAIRQFLHVSRLSASEVVVDQQTSSIRSKIRSNFERSSIHGVSDLLTAKHRYERFFWMLAIVIAFVIMTYEMTRVIMEYREERVAADIIPSEVTSYPIIVYCPFDWVDRDTARKIKFGTGEYLYLESLSIYGRLFRHFVSESANYTSVYEKYKKNFNRLLAKHVATNDSRSLETFLMNISQPIETIFEDGFMQREIKIQSVQKLVNQFGVCYGVQLPAHATTYLYMAEMPIHIKTPARRFLSDHFVRQKAVQRRSNILIGHVATGVSPLEGHIITEGPHLYQIKLKAFYLSREDTRSKHCKNWNTKEQVKSYAKCINQFCIDAGSCTYLQPENLGQLTTTTGVCSRMSPYICYPPPGVQQACWANAPVPCKEWTYESSISQIPIPSGPNGSDRMTVYISFSNPLSVLRISEHKLYSFESFMSNVGGMISLWCGASVLSLAQLLYFLMKYLSYRRRQRVCRAIVQTELAKRPSNFSIHGYKCTAV